MRPEGERLGPVVRRHVGDHGADVGVPCHDIPVQDLAVERQELVPHGDVEAIGLGGVPVCMAKTQYSFSDDPTKLGRPRGFRITVREVTPSAGAGFVVVKTGDIMTMPGLAEHPAAEAMRVEEDGTILGLF